MRIRTSPSFDRFTRAVGALAVLAGPCVLTTAAQNSSRAPALEPAYTVELVPLPPGSKLIADLNDAGEVVATVSNGGLRAFQWSDGTLTELGFPAGLDTQDARGVAVTAIDEEGTAVGTYQLAPVVRFGWHPVRWVDGVAEELPMPPSGSVASWAAAPPSVSPSGLIAASGWPFETITPGWVDENGWDEEPSFHPGNDPMRGFLWDGQGNRTTLPSLPSTAGPEQTGTRVIGVNDAGQVVSWQNDPHRVQGFVFDPEQGVLRLPTGGAHTCAPLAINAEGVIAGTIHFSDPNVALRKDVPVIWKDGRVHELGTLPGFWTGTADDLNDRGVVVGHFVATDITVKTAFVHVNGRLHDLQDLIPANSPWDLDRAFAVNDRGQIVVSGMLHGSPELFLLTPTDNPHVFIR